MRTNIVIDDRLIAEALKLSGKKSKRDVVHFALKTLVSSLKNTSQKRNEFISSYIDNPLQIDGFSPLKRNDIHQ